MKFSIVLDRPIRIINDSKEEWVKTASVEDIKKELKNFIDSIQESGIIIPVYRVEELINYIKKINPNFKNQK